MSSIQLDKNVAGEGETVVGVLQDASLDFTTIPSHLRGAFSVKLHAVGGVSAALVFIVPTFRFTGPRTVEFEIPPVGPLTPTGSHVPEGAYNVLFNYGFWAATGFPQLRVQRAPTVAPALPPGAAPSTPTPRRPPARSTRTMRYPYPPGWGLSTSMARALSLFIIPLARLLTRLWSFAPVMLITGRIPLRSFGAVGRGRRAVARFWAPTPPGRGPTSSVEPLIDAEENFPVFERLIEEADKFVYIATLAFDETTNLKNTSQAYGPSQPPNLWRSIEVALKERAKRDPANPISIKVLLWETTLFADANEYEPEMTDVGDLQIVEQRWGAVRGSSFSDFLANLRRASGAPEDLLRKFYDGYQGRSPNDDLPFPTGIHVALEDHPTRSVLGSHHQKLILTDKAGWIGGLNTLKQQWDLKGHWAGDQRRASSGEGPYSAGVGQNAPWHDTGALVRGPILEDVFRTFAERWDAAVQTRGPHDPIAGAIPTFGTGSLESELRGASETRRSRFDGARSGAAWTLDPTYAVDEAHVAVTLPRGTAWAHARGATQIKDHYDRALAEMNDPDSFIYLENQYFTDFRYTKSIYTRWRTNLLMGPPQEVRKYFAFIVLPYKPQPTRDWTTGRGIYDISFAEMQCIKWLEVKTARVVFKRDADGYWVRYCAVQNPVNDVEFVDPAENGDPEEIGKSSTFRVKNAVEVNPDGSWRYDAAGNPQIIQPDPELDADDVMTDSDVMGYTVVSREVARGSSSQPLEGSHVSGEDVEERLHEFLDPFHIYMHSKASTFYNQASGVYVATVGSANLNPRSLDDGGDQDSEMNVFWRGEARVRDLRDRLWEHHLRRAVTDEAEWADTAWKNLETIMKARSNALDGTVVRLDVVDRYEQL